MFKCRTYSVSINFLDQFILEVVGFAGSKIWEIYFRKRTLHNLYKIIECQHHTSCQICRTLKKLLKTNYWNESRFVLIHITIAYVAIKHMQERRIILEIKWPILFDSTSVRNLFQSAFEFQALIYIIIGLSQIY